MIMISIIYVNVNARLNSYKIIRNYLQLRIEDGKSFRSLSGDADLIMIIIWFALNNAYFESIISHVVLVVGAFHCGSFVRSNEKYRKNSFALAKLVFLSPQILQFYARFTIVMEPRLFDSLLLFL